MSITTATNSAVRRGRGLRLLVGLCLLLPRVALAQVLPPGGGGSGSGGVASVCVDQVGVGLTVQGTLSCATVTGTMTDTSVAKTGGDLSAASLVISTHLAAPLPFGQGGHGLTSGAPGGVLYFPTTTSLGSSLVLGAGLPVVGGGPGLAPFTGTKTGTGTVFSTATPPFTPDRQLTYDPNGNLVVTPFFLGMPTQAGLTWAVNTGTCTGDSSGGKLTVNGSLQIVCAADLGGGTIVQLNDPGSPGVVVRTEVGTTVARTITGTALEILVSEGTGVAGNPTLALAAVNGDPGTFSNPTVTVDTKGRITAITDGGGGPVCLTKLSNPNGIAGADIPISTTPALVFTPDITSCEGFVVNTSTLHALRCRGPENGMVSATAGTLLKPGAVLKLGAEARTGLACIRDTSAPSDVGVTIAVSTMLIKP